MLLRSFSTRLPTWLRCTKNWKTSSWIRTRGPVDCVRGTSIRDGAARAHNSSLRGFPLGRLPWAPARFLQLDDTRFFTRLPVHVTLSLEVLQHHLFVVHTLYVLRQ